MDPLFQEHLSEFIHSDISLGMLVICNSVARGSCTSPATRKKGMLRALLEGRDLHREGSLVHRHRWGGGKVGFCPPSSCCLQLECIRSHLDHIH